MGNQKVGLEAVFENKEFQKGLAQFLKGLDAAVKAAEAAGGGIDSGMSGASDGTKKLGIAGIATGNIMADIFTRGIDLAMNALKGLFRVMGDVLRRFLDFGKSAILTSGRVQEMDIVLGVLGRNAGLAANEVQAAVEAVKDMGIQTDVAQNTVGAFIRNNLEMAKSSELARTAQDFAVLTMSDSSETLDRLIWGVTTFNSRILRTAGVMVDMQKAFEIYAEENDTTVEAMSSTEKQAAALNAVLEQGEDVAGAYEAAMLSPAKRLRSLSRKIFEVRNEAGKPFQDAFLQAVFIMEDFVGATLEAVSAGGVLQETLMKTGATASVVLEGIRNFLASARTEIIGFAPTLINTFSDLASRALSWGVNIATQFASGIIQGASTALATAMNFITRVLTGWLAPGSPPKILPNLDLWGAQAFEEYLKGMTKANLAPIKELQKLVAEKVGFKNLIELENDLIKATDRLRKAEDDLENSRKSRLDGQKELAKLIERQNRLIAEGATEAELAANLDAIEAQEDLINAAAEEEEIAQDRIDTAEDEVDLIKEQIKLQRDLIQQISKLMREQQKAAGAGGAAGIPGLDELAGAGLGALPPIEQTIDEALEKMKASIKRKFEELFKPLTDAWNEDIVPALDLLQIAWEQFTNTIKQFWDEKIEPLLGRISEFLPPDFIERLGFWAGQMTAWIAIGAVLVGSILLIGAVLLALVGPILLAIGFVKLLQAAWEGLVWVWEQKIIPIGEAVREFIDNLIISLSQTMLDAVQGAIDLWSLFTIGLQGVATWLETVWDWIVEVAAALGLMELPDDFTPGSPTPFEMGLRGISDAMKQLSNTDIPNLAESLNLDPVAVSSGSAGGASSTVINNNQQSTQEVNITNPQQSNQSIADDLIFANAIRGS